MPFCSRAPEQNGGPNLRRAGHGIGGAHYPISLSAHCLLPRRFPRRALCFAGPLRTAPAPNATGPACHGLICRFAAGPGEPQPINGSDEQMFGRNEQNPGAGSMRLNGIGPMMCEREECVSSEASPHTQSEDGRV